MRHHAAFTREDEVGSLDEARARGLLSALAVEMLVVVVVFGGVGLSLHKVLSESPACSRGLRWPRRDVSGYWQRRCLFAHWLKKPLRFVRVCKSRFFTDHERKTDGCAIGKGWLKGRRKICGVVRWKVG